MLPRPATFNRALRTLCTRSITRSPQSSTSLLSTKTFISTGEAKLTATARLHKCSPTLLAHRSFSITAVSRNNAPLDATTAPTDSEEAVKADHHPEPTASATVAETSAAATPDSTPAPVAEEASHSTIASTATDEAAAAEELRQRTIFVGGLSFAVDSSWLSDELLRLLDATDASLIENVRVARNPMGKSKGFAFVTLADKADAIKLAELSDRALAGSDGAQGSLEIDGRAVTLAISSQASKPRHTSQGAAGPRGSDLAGSSAQRPRNDPSTTLWLGNLPWSTTDSDIEQALAPFYPDGDHAEPKRISLPTDSETGRARGIAYVEFESVDVAQDVLKRLDQDQDQGGLVLEGRNVRVDFAPVRRPSGASSNFRERRGGGGGGGGFRGGRGGYGGGRDGGDRRGFDRRGGGGRGGAREDNW